MAKKRRRFETFYKWVFVLMCAFSVMPWFDKGQVTSAYWGVGMLQYFAIPFVYIFFMMWVQEGRLGWLQLLLGEIAYLFILAVLGYTFFHCMRVMFWIDDPVDWRVSMETSLPPFWSCCFFSICGAVFFPVYIRNRNLSLKGGLY